MAYHAGMPRFAVLLRVLLCFVLLLNGAAYAHAATGMAMGNAAKEQARGDAPPCHEGMDMAAPMDHEGAGSSGHHDDADGLPDCCKAGSCDGFCTHHASALTWRMPLDARLHPAMLTPAYRADAHASVRLPHRLRPPILAA